MHVRNTTISARPREVSPLIDEIGRKLLDELQKDARLSFAELGRRVGLSPSATSERLRNLEDAGVIRGYHVDVDPASLGLSVAAIIRMACDGEQYRRFVAFLDTCEDVRECHHVTGSDALMIKVLVGSIEELEQLVMKFLRFGVPTTSIVLSSPLTRNLYRLDDLPGEKIIPRTTGIGFHGDRLES
jgi:Lrp/AsnC family leucine-responsive transcriptional regulator